MQRLGLGFLRGAARSLGAPALTGLGAPLLRISRACCHLQLLLQGRRARTLEPLEQLVFDLLVFLGRQRSRLERDLGLEEQPAGRPLPPDGPPSHAANRPGMVPGVTAS